MVSSCKSETFFLLKALQKMSLKCLKKIEYFGDISSIEENIGF